MPTIYRENRSFLTGATARIFLDPLRAEGVVIDTLDSGDHVKYKVIRGDASVHVALTDAAYQVVYTNDKGEVIRAWAATFDTPTTITSTKEVLQIEWDVNLGGTQGYAYDKIEVTARPF